MIGAIESWRWILFLLLTAAAVSDIRSLRIPNAISIAIAFSLIVALVAGGAGKGEYFAALASGVLGLGVGYFLYALGLMGAGDGKLFAAAAAWFPPSSLLGLGLYVSLAGALLSALMLTAIFIRDAKRRPASTAGAVPAMKTPVPYGVAIAAGVIIASQTMIAI